VLVEIEHHRVRNLLAREGQELAHELGGSFSRDADLLNVFSAGGSSLDVLSKELRVVDDDTEDVVEIVGDASRELADGLHLL
jgi:hypothetical protein